MTILEKVKEAEKLFSDYEITGNELARVQKLREKLESDHVTVSVIGQFKRGKSALVNGILEDTVLPVGIVPVTAVVTTVEYGEKSAAVHFNNGVVKSTRSVCGESEVVVDHLSVEKNCDHCVTCNTTVLIQLRSTDEDIISLPYVSADASVGDRCGNIVYSTAVAVVRLISH